MRLFTILTIGAALAFSGMAGAQTRPAHPAARAGRPAGAAAKSIGKFEDWQAATHVEGGQNVCYAFTRAQSSAPAVAGRGDVVLTVTQRPSGRDAVAISAGFTYPANAEAVMVVERAEMPFYTSGRSAFARDGHLGHGGVREGADGGGEVAGAAWGGGGGYVQLAGVWGSLFRHQSGLWGQMTSVAELTAAERERVLAKSALFNPPDVQLADGRRELVGLSREELVGELEGIGEKAFRAKQIWHWVYHQGVTEFSAMSSIARPLQGRLAERFVVGRPEVASVQTSSDETRKWLFRFRDGQEAETVYIPDRHEDRGAVCISSQVGCTLSCRFCHTGTQRLVRNLGAAEIVGQFMAARDAYGEWPSPTGETPRLLSTIVLMGMGEPLYNYENVAQAMRIVMDGEGIGLSRRRITLSTSGVVPMMDRCGAELGINLAVSLHAVTDELRDEIVPLNRKYPIAELMAACRRYPGASNARRITFEYVMLRGVNDSEGEARALVRLIAGIPAKVNLIPFNPWPGSAYEPSTRERLSRFAAIVSEAGFASPIRAPRGQDILAACGQLRTESAKAGGRTVQPAA